MSRSRIALSVAAGVVVLAGAGTFAIAQASEQSPTLAHGSAHYVAPAGGRDGTLLFTADVTASSGVKSLKVLAWPAASALGDNEPTAKEMTQVESATCKPIDAGNTVRCTYTTPVTGSDAATSPHGTWHIAVLATATSGATTLDTKAADFEVA
ncbi:MULTISPECIES: DUF5707 domain-containing protein [unclassified Streptomyces]|uniref:DUF5707 domain-containing protein n=1 Tax=unclassified Streptomyces TaxID=2593676 RepID=UPI003809D64D